MQRKVIFAIAVGAGIAAGVTAGVIFYRKKRKKAKLPSEELRRMAIERLEAMRAGVEAEEAAHEWDPKEYVVIEEDFEPAEPETSYRVVASEKAPLEEIDVPEEEPEPEADEEEEEDVMEDLQPVLDGVQTRWGTDSVMFDEAGIPQFADEDYDGEEGRIEQIWHEDYHDLDDWNGYTRDVAVWFPNGGVLCNMDMEPIEVVDSVGPTAFTKLMADPEGVYHVANLTDKRLYELSVNKMPLEEVMEEVYPLWNTSTGM